MTRRILEADPTERSASAGKRRLSRRRVRKLVRISQIWTDDAGVVFCVMNIYRADALVALAGEHGELKFVRFGELGRHYRLVDES